jgi:hypothetical protein
MTSNDTASKAETFREEVRRAFIAYTEHALSVLANKQRLKDKLVYIDPKSILLSRVQELEHSAQFNKLVDTTTSSFINDALTQADRALVNIALRNFFRRTGFYTDSFEGGRISPDEMFMAFWSASFYREVKLPKFTVLTDVEFTNQIIDCNLFKVQKYTKAELDKITARKVSEIFYPSELIDTDKLDQHWLIVDTDSTSLGLTTETGFLTSFSISDDWQGPGTGPKIPELSIQLLAIHDWQPDLSEEDCFEKFHVEIEDLKEQW